MSQKILFLFSLRLNRIRKTYPTITTRSNADASRRAPSLSFVRLADANIYECCDNRSGSNNAVLISKTML